MNPEPLSPNATPESLDGLWVCWEDGEPVAVWARWMAESWMRRANYMHKSISPWSMQSPEGKASIFHHLAQGVS